MANVTAANAAAAREHLTAAAQSGAFAARMAAPRGYDPNRFTKLFTGARGALYYTHLSTGKKVYLTKSQRARCLRTAADAPVSLLPGDVNNECRYVVEDTAPRAARHAHARYDVAAGRWVRGYGGAKIERDEGGAAE
uniref:Uncharacterized protein n=1 Tax=viral metagenome TaxID=1070528 RepID=A0A6C0ATN8_9ZZZZ